MMRPLLRPTLKRIPPFSHPLRVTSYTAVHHTSASNVAPVQLPKLIVAHGSPNHNSLSSFLDYAARRQLKPHTTVFLGTSYEYRVAESLQRLGFSLVRTGGSNDAGIDLIGHWMLSVFREPIPTILQCKFSKKSCSPNEVRALEGSFRSIPPDWRNKDVLGVLVTTLKATEGMRRQMLQSTRPLAFIQVSPTGTITQFIWNRAATERGLEGVGVTPRYTIIPPEKQALRLPAFSIASVPPEKNFGALLDIDPTMKRQRHKSITVIDVQLTWLGTPISPDSEEIATRTLEQINAITEVKVVKPKRGPGRPKGAKNKPKDPAKRAARRPNGSTKQLENVIARGPGRPMGAKDKKPRARQVRLQQNHISNATEDGD